MKAKLGPIKPASLLGLGAAATVLSCLAFSAPSHAAATSGVRFQANTDGLQSILNPGGPGSFTSSTTLQCPNTSCIVTNELGSLFVSATSYTPFAFNYTADNLQVLTTTPEGALTYTKDYTGTLAGFTIFGGVNPLAVVNITGPTAGIFDGTYLPTAAFPEGELQNRNTNAYQAPATVQANGKTYSTAVVLYTTYSQFGWTNNFTIPVTLASASNVWVYVDESSVVTSAVPSPLPILGAAATFAWARRLRKTIRSIA